MTFTPLDKPSRIVGALSKNHVARAAHAANIAGTMRMSAELMADHEVRACWEVGLAIIEIMGVHSTSPIGLNASSLTIGHGYEAPVRAMGHAGAKVFQQLWSVGHLARVLDGATHWSASDVIGPTLGVVPGAKCEGRLAGAGV